MSPESSPFTPGQPVSPELFVGRKKEAERLRGMVRTAAAGRFRIGFVTGERGIGKSSLAALVRRAGEQEDGMGGTQVQLGGVSDLGEMVRRTFEQLIRDNTGHGWFSKLRQFFGNQVSEVGLFGISVKLKLSDEDLSDLVRNFVHSLKALTAKLKDNRKGLLLIWDDINGLASSKEVADWLKSTVDEAALVPGGLPVCILIVGFEERRQSLISLQPSLARVFDVVDIAPWSAEETRAFYNEAFGLAGATLSPEAVSLMTEFSGGLPTFAQEIGDAVWRVAESKEVDVHVANDGVMEATEIIGRKLLKPQVVDAIRSDKYRSILKKLPGLSSGGSFKRAELIDRLTAEEGRVLDNFLTSMKKLGAIVPDKEAARGSYRFANLITNLYFGLEASRAQRRPSGNG